MVKEIREDPSDTLPLVSIIVACRSIDPYVKECILESLRLEYPRFETIVVPDKEADLGPIPTVVIPTGPIPPSEKRNLGVKFSKGELLAFIDGDAYPTRDWLRNAIKYLENKDIVAIGGPGLTPESDTMMQQASGEILSSFLGSGPLSFRHSSKVARKSDDLPTVNLIIRRSAFDQIGGFDVTCWPGEDTKLCLDLVYHLRKDILYAPDVQVYHHRRHLFREHLGQIAGYGYHRGYFAKKFPENSRKPLYFIPSIIALGLPTLLVVGYFYKTLEPFSFLPAILYVAAIGVSAAIIGVKRQNLRLSIAVFFGAIATHVCYGLYFVKGLLSNKIEPKRVKLQI